MIRLRFLSFLVILLFSTRPLSSQVVSTLVPTIGDPRIEAITLNPNGYLYTLSFQGGQIYKIDPATAVVQTIASGFPGPLGGAVDLDSNFYFSDFYQNRVYKVLPDDSYNIFASGFSGPTGLVMDPDGDTLYVSNYNNDAIYKVSLADSTVHTYLQGNGINGPDGLIFGADGSLYIANFDDNRIHKVDTNDQITQFATLTSPNSGYITLVDSTFYICGFYSNQIHAIDQNGNSSVVAGTGLPGSLDGPASQAEFFQPNGIARTPSGDSLFITGGTPNGKIRVLDLKAVAASGTGENTHPNAAPPNLNLAPNPAIGRTHILFELLHPGKPSIELFTPSGKLVQRWDGRELEAGPHAIPLDLGELPAGNYQIVLRSEEGIRSGNLVIQR